MKRKIQIAVGVCLSFAGVPLAYIYFGAGAAIAVVLFLLLMNPLNWFKASKTDDVGSSRDNQNRDLGKVQ